MASSKLMMKMSSSTSRNSDLIRRKSSNSSSSSSSTNHHHHHKHPSIRINNNSGVFDMTVDGLLPTVHNNNEQQAPESTLLDAEITLLDAAVRTSSNGGQKTVDDVWKEIVAGRSCKQEVPDEMMTLEDFLAKAGAVEEEDVKIPPPPLPSERLSGGIFSFDNPIHPPNVDGVVGFGIGVDEMGGRGKRRAILEPLDKAAQQRQRRMIKNRESAARSRERKQAYQAELESLAVKLEEENETLLKAKAEQTRKRYKQLLDLPSRSEACYHEEQQLTSGIHLLVNAQTIVRLSNYILRVSIRVL
ncbi:Basic-leucine zipper domain-containing protein [Cynara cardunculus var. scolymus]|uniref:Basic-leucine zipper domain-containing protein n=1 Tax=Cynara cardunculus var. scolymus TaxID=59895 RepID=A0A118K4A4_CYNCS|nr:Basic-leucine zipper domain-containing protein [Cynara cardunculus var. scolymus]